MKLLDPRTDPVKMARGIRHPRRIDSDFFVRLYVLVACMSAGMGAVLLGGGHQRFSGAEWRGARELVSWMPYWEPWVYWAALFILHALALGISLWRRWAVDVLRFGIVIYAFLVISLFDSMLRDSTVAGVGVVVFFGLALLHLFMSDHLREHGWGR